MLPTDIRIQDVAFSFEDYLYRTPIKFGGVALDRVTLLNVEIAVATRSGKTARGIGSMPLGNVWAFPSRVLKYEQTLSAMVILAQRIAGHTSRCTEYGHPICLTHALEPGYLREAEETTKSLGLAEPIPPLATLVCASPFDAALHDAYGKVHECSAYHTYGPHFLEPDLGHFLGAEFAGERLDAFVLREPKPRMPLYHLVGALDPIEREDVVKPVGDGLPEFLGEWIDFNGLTHLKIKLNGDDLAWDVERVLRVNTVAERHQSRRGLQQWWYSLDFNERCQNVGYLLEFLHRVKDQTPFGFERIQYIEQPTARDLKANQANVMHEAARLRPIVIDEALIDLESLQLARSMGYSGAALKACKGQSQSLLMAAAAQKYQMFLCVQDLTCVGASLLHSAGLAAHIPGVAAIEANGRQYCPAANSPWEKRYPGIFHITDGTMATECLNGPGLGT